MAEVVNREVFESLENQMLLTIEIHSVTWIYHFLLFFFISTPKSITFATDISIFYYCSTSTFCHIISRINSLRVQNMQKSSIYKLSKHCELIEEIWRPISFSPTEVPLLRDPLISSFIVFETLKGEITSVLQNLCL